MNSKDAVNLLGLLNVARGNAKAAHSELKKVVWPKDTMPIGSSIGRATLALEQTMQIVQRILEDLK